ncbi:MAG: glycerol-3-phosphate 1-O-acyltransferase PlsY [Clostridia bacterium]|nr:glycerol-3-phosphate 1-O-acyltransferase PlsY [Clostridia bacterium]
MLESFTATTAALFVVTVLLSYFMGNISPAILLGRLHGVDIKSEGSGNAGTTNVLRVLGKKAAVATLVIDIGKGVAAVLFGKLVGYYIFGFNGPYLMAMFCGLAVFCGHIWPLAFNFKGGKGVATAFGVLVAFKPLLGLCELAIVIVVVLVTRKVSLGSIIGAISLPIVAYFAFPLYFFNKVYLCWALAMAVIVLAKHRTNMVRLIKGKESNISFGKNKSA